MGRKPCCSKEGLKKGSWTKKEDLLLTEYIKDFGEGTGWRSLPKKAEKGDAESSLPTGDYSTLRPKDD
ncbi:hypothetical protein H5410_039706 [Solanum commersonii]|uniref:Myb-like domain-containing protein n=1 Tax=Solanum commersonii TaxID=4109 RepID=A0A9J5XQ02_SOLCO|nr:hypothetical protein H5410_039706 [Solanum commersonii]